MPSPLLIDSDEVLRVSFTLKGTDGEKLPADKRPHQVVVQLQDGADASIATTSIVGIKPSSGKASWSQVRNWREVAILPRAASEIDVLTRKRVASCRLLKRMDRLPPVLLRGQSGEVKVSLLMGFFGNSAPVQLPLATLRLPLAVAASDAGAASSLREKNMAAQGFERLPERRHTFAVPAADQMPPAIVSLGVAAATLALPWVVLVALWSSVMSALTLKAPGSATLPFLGMLAVLDGLALLYWNGAGLTLFKMLPWLLLLSTITLVVGRNAFTEMRRVRLGKQQG